MFEKPIKWTFGNFLIVSEFNAAKKIVRTLKVACVTLDGIQIFPGGKVQANIRR